VSIDTLYRKGGDAYSGLSDVVALIPGRSVRAIAHVVLRHLVVLDRRGELDERVTDLAIAEATEYSTRSVQRALHALHRVLGQLGCAVIDRVREHGRRVISFVRGLASSGTKPFVPPCTPPEGDKNTTTGSGSSSSLSITPEKAEAGRPPVDPELVARACRLIPGKDGADPGKVADAAAVYGADHIHHALDVVERRNQRGARDGKIPVFSWGFVLGILAKRKREGWEPPQPAEPTRAVATPALAPVAEAPRGQPLTAEEVAELVRRCQSRSRFDLPLLARAQLRAALAEGSVPAELVATIPPALLEDPRAP
jgi:hypothetical protein